MAERSVMPPVPPERELPPAETRAVNPQWNEAAEQIGSALGRAVATVRDMPARADQVKSEMRDRFEVIRGRGREKGAGVASRVRETAERKANELKERARENVHVARNRAQRLVRERPLQVILAAFGAAFIMGAVLRIWRSSSD